MRGEASVKAVNPARANRVLSQFSPITWALLAVLLLHVAVTVTIAFAFNERDLPKQLNDFLHLMAWRSDSWSPMRTALLYLHGPHDAAKTVYQAIFFEDKVKFQYPLTSLFLYEPVAGFSEQTATHILSGLSWLSLLLTPIPLFLLLRESVRAYAPDTMRGGRLDVAAQFGLIVALTYLFYPLVKAYHIGQVQAWLNLAFAVMVWLWIQRRDTACAIVLAACCMVKPQLSLLLLWGAVRKRWRFVITAGVCIALGELLAMALYGVRNNFDYLRVLSFLSIHGEAYQHNQSLNGLLNRLFYPQISNDWQFHSFPPENPVVRYGGALMALGASAAALLARFGGARRSDPLDLAGAGLFCALASPIAWEHHYGISAVLFVLLLPTVMKQGARWKLAALAGLFVLCATHFAARAYTSVPLNLIQSLMFYGELGLAYFAVTAPAWPAQTGMAKTSPGWREGARAAPGL
jgi:hypothetical protein